MPFLDFNFFIIFVCKMSKISALNQNSADNLQTPLLLLSYDASCCLHYLYKSLFYRHFFLCPVKQNIQHASR